MSAACGAGRRPNLLFILADQLRAMCADSAGSPGADPAETPHLDALAAAGIGLPHAVSCYPVCSPHRAMLVTSQYPHANGITHNVNSETAEHGVRLRAGVGSWGQALADAGYRTGWIGKWHLEPPTAEDAVFGEGRRDDGKVWDAYSPPEARHGFGFWHSYGCCDNHLAPHYWEGDAPREARIDVDAWSAEHETDVALQFLDDAAAGPEPFALVVSFNPPHQPFDQLPAWADPSYRALAPEALLTRPNVDLTSGVGEEAVAIAPLYFAAVAGIDAQVGRLTAALERLGLADDTLVVVTSDHGQQMGSHGLLYKNVPFEESLRIPFVARFPGRLPAATRPETVLSSVDVGPTLLGLLGSPPMEGAAGQDRSAHLTGAGSSADPGHALYFRWPEVAARPDAGKADGGTLASGAGARSSAAAEASPGGLPEAFADPASHVRGLRTVHAMTMVAWNPEAGLLAARYDLVEDPFQLAPQFAGPALEADCRRLAGELRRIGDPFPAVADLERMQPAGPAPVLGTA